MGVYEEMCRFHIIAEHELCEFSASASNPHGFNSHLNVEQLYKCLTSLFSLYDYLHSVGQPQHNEPEFRAYHILLTMDTHGKYRRDATAHAFALGKMREHVLRSPRESCLSLPLSLPFLSPFPSSVRWRLSLTVLLRNVRGDGDALLLAIIRPRRKLNHRIQRNRKPGAILPLLAREITIQQT